MLQIYSRFAIIGTLFFAMLFTSCQDNTHPVPNVPVNISINLDLPSYIPLQAPGGSAYVNGGSRGIVVYRNFNEFVALDRHGTHDASNPDAIVMIDTLNPFELVDTTSDTRYSILSGVVLSGPAQFPLRRYNATWNGLYTVNIYN